MEVLVRPTDSGAQGAPYVDLQMLAKEDPQVFKQFKFAEFCFLKEAMDAYPGLFASLQYVSVNFYNDVFADDFLDQVLKLLSPEKARKIKIELLEETPYPPKRSPLHNPEIMSGIAALQDKLSHFCGKLAADDLSTDDFKILTERYAGIFDTLKLDAICKDVFFFEKNPNSKATYPSVCAGEKKINDGTAVDADDADVAAYRCHMTALRNYAELLNFAMTHGMTIIFEASIKEHDERMEYVIPRLQEVCAELYPTLPPHAINPFQNPRCLIQGGGTMEKAFQPEELATAMEISSSY